MREWIARKLPELKDLAGFVLKARSPSCGIGDAKLNGGPECTDGLFAAALRREYPLMVLRNEESFATEADCALFVKQLEDVALLQRVEACVRDLLANSPACHDWDHTLRVWNSMMMLGSSGAISTGVKASPCSKSDWNGMSPSVFSTAMIGKSVRSFAAARASLSASF